MKKFISLFALSLMLSGCYIDIGGIIDILNSNMPNDNNGGNKTSQIVSGSSKEKGLVGTDYLNYYSDISGCEYFPSTGNRKMLVVPVMFKGESLRNSSQVIKDLDLVFNGSEESTGWESVSSYYYESSYGKLNIEADVYDEFINIDKTVSQVANLGNEYDDPTIYVVNYVHNYLKDKIDLSIYDSDKDGLVDGVWLVYGNGSYSNYFSNSSAVEDLLWAYTYWNVDAKKDLSNPGFNVYCWGSYDFMYESKKSDPSIKVDAHTLIHETGHMLGLDDYYDYDGDKNPTGCLDMMDYNIGDHNSYSKWMLGWVEPKVFNFEEGVMELKSFTETGEFIIVPSNDGIDYTPLSEYLAIEFYTPTGLNKLDSSKAYLGSYPKMFSEYGVRVYHVDSRLGEFIYQRGDWYYNDYVYNYSIDDLYSKTGYENYFAIFNNNTPSYSYEEDNKLIRLVSAYRGNNYVFDDDESAKNSDLFSNGSSLVNFKFNNNKYLDFNIEFVVRDNTLKVIFD